MKLQGGGSVLRNSYTCEVGDLLCLQLGNSTTNSQRRSVLENLARDDFVSSSSSSSSSSSRSSSSSSSSHQKVDSTSAAVPTAAEAAVAA